METIGLEISCIFLAILTIISINYKNKKQIHKIFLLDVLITLVWCLAILIFKFLNENSVPNIYYWIVITDICTICLPVAFYFTGLIFAKTKITFKKSYLLIFIIPIISMIILLTDNYHHLLKVHFSTNMNEIVFGKYFTIYSIYNDILYIIGIIYLVKFSIKNSGIFSKQAILMSLGCAIPLVINILGTFSIIPMTVYITPICFSITVSLFAIAIFKFQFLGITPIALKTIVDRISDSFVVIGDDEKIIDYNQTLIDVFKIKQEKIRGMNFFKFLEERNAPKAMISKFQKGLEKTNLTKKEVTFEFNIEGIDKIFNVEITPINSEGGPLGTLVLLKDITQHKRDMQIIQNNQDILMERERLASLGQLIGGIAHNLKTPIMSIAGAAEALEQLIKEYDESIDDPLVNSQDHHEIAGDMQSWIPKIRAHTEYMSDIITTVKGQAVALSNNEGAPFTVGELVKRVNILMKHELKKSYIYLNVMMKTDEELTMFGDVNSLVQIVNNMISNSIQAYNGQRDRNIELEVNKKENDVILTIRDYAGGLPKEVEEKLFKQMVTTKGKNGTGLGLYMSYSNIKARFGGDITYSVNPGIGTEFNIIIPLKK